MPTMEAVRHVNFEIGRAQLADVARIAAAHQDSIRSIGAQFYKANGFEEVGRGQHRLWSGRPMACVFMRKELRRGRALP
jgi:hypothetical protein